MNDINEMPPKCQSCSYWEVCEYPWVCPDRKQPAADTISRVKRDLDGIYLRIKRDGKYQNLCLSDMTREELEENLKADRGEWLKGAVIHLALTLHDIGEQFGIVRSDEE